MTVSLAMAGGASRSVRVLHLTTILVLETQPSSSIREDERDRRGKRKVYYHVAMSIEVQLNYHFGDPCRQSSVSSY
jgi:hypothetical protein